MSCTTMLDSVTLTTSHILLRGHKIILHVSKEGALKKLRLNQLEILQIFVKDLWIKSLGLTLAKIRPSLYLLLLNVISDF